MGVDVSSLGETSVWIQNTVLFSIMKCILISSVGYVEVMFGNHELRLVEGQAPISC